MSVKKPNFLIIGAAKSGTTSLYDYLQQHPEVAMSRHKEPHYFSRRVVGKNEAVFVSNKQADPLLDLQGKKPKLDLSAENYLRNFCHVENEKAIGEASVSYLAVPGVAELIRNEYPEIKIIAILRDPVERAYSA